MSSASVPQIATIYLTLSIAKENHRSFLASSVEAWTMVEVTYSDDSDAQWRSSTRTVGLVPVSLRMRIHGIDFFASTGQRYHQVFHGDIRQGHLLGL